MTVQPDWAKGEGLLPMVVQHAQTGEVLMLGYVDEAAVKETEASGLVTFFSRSKQRLWTKGETSGNRLQVSKLWIDCDEDTVLVEATCLGDGVVCHTGTRTCFRELPVTDGWAEGAPS